ncbi:MAG: hypothetical protein ACHQ2Y_04320 [Candidatus Lutacidiplasmatales archaeon]
MEQLRPCVMFGKGTCPDCYAEPLLKLRLSTSRARRAKPNHSHPSTPRHGLVRLGTYREILPDDYAAFKAGSGVWDCCGERWERPDFKTRSFFLITRGLLPLSFYETVHDDPACVNVQVSVDMDSRGIVTPPEDRLADLAKLPKVIFRAKTRPETARVWDSLFDRLSVAVGRVMETPLRSRVLETKLQEGHFAYGRATPLERAGWDVRTFLRCNTACRDCVKENGVLACAVRPATVAALPSRARPAPPRHTLRLSQIAWADEARRFLAESGGAGTVKEAYAWFAERFPELVVGKPSWQFKVRVALQRAGIQEVRGTWHLPDATLESYAPAP